MEQTALIPRVKDFLFASGEIRIYQLLSLISLSGAAIMPPDGLGFSICLFYNTTGLPDFGCGLTRALSSILHLRFWDAVLYNPFAYPVAAVSILFILSIFTDTLADLYYRHKRALIWLTLGGVLMLAGYGFLRLYLTIYLHNHPDEFLTVFAGMDWVYTIIGKFRY